MMAFLFVPRTQAAPPDLPFSPYGIVTIDGAPVPAGTLIAAYCGGNVYRSTFTRRKPAPPGTRIWTSLATILQRCERGLCIR